jgi:iron complex outermembrane receptor protein
MKKLAFLLLLTMLAPRPVQSQTAELSKTDTINLEEVVVTGSPVRVNRNFIPMAVSVVNIQQQVADDESALLPVLSGRVPGLFVTERGITGFGVSSGAAGQITMRGIGGNPTTGVLILIDGHPQFMGIFGHPLADSYVASDVDRVEVIRGPASILYGSNAMGGVINIITRKQTQDGFHGNGRLMVGSYNTQKYMAAAGFRKKGLTAFASVNHDQTDGHRPNSDFSITNGYAKLGYVLNNHIRTGADFSIAAFNATDPGPDTVNAVAGQSIDITRGYWSAFLENEYEKFSGSAKLYYNFGEHTISDGFHSTDKNYGITVYETLRLFNGNNLTIGADHANYGGKAENEKAAVVFADTTVYETGIYGFVQQTLFQKLTLNAGIRLQYHKVTGKEWVPSGGLAYQATKTTAIKLNISKGFRSPTIRELFLWNHNPDLAPERIMNYEAGISQVFFQRKLVIDLTGFYVTGDNLIVSGAMGMLYNTGSLENRGIEIGINATPVPDLSLNASYSYIAMQNPVYATPRNQLYISGNYKFNKFSIMAGLHVVDGLDTDASASVNTNETYILTNTRLNYMPFKFIGFFITGENLLDQSYETNHYYTMPGITVFGGMLCKF